MQDYIGCHIEKENEDSYDITVTAADGSVHPLTVSKSEMKPMRLPFVSQIFPDNMGLLYCEVLEKNEETVFVSVKGEPASDAARLEVPLSALARRMPPSEKN